MSRLFLVAVYLCYALPTQAQITEKQILFRYSCNLIDVPTSLQVTKNIVWQTSNGSFYIAKNTIHLYPDSTGKCKVWATFAGKTVWEDEYEVRAIPKPIYFWANERGDTIKDTNKMLPIELKYQYCAKAENAYFQSTKAKYTGNVYGWLYRNRIPIKEIHYSLNNPIDFRDVGAKAGDTIYVYADIFMCQEARGHYHHFPRHQGFWVFFK